MNVCLHFICVPAEHLCIFGTTCHIPPQFFYHLPTLTPQKICFAWALFARAHMCSLLYMPHACICLASVFLFPTTCSSLPALPAHVHMLTFCACLMCISCLTMSCSCLLLLPLTLSSLHLCLPLLYYICTFLMPVPACLLLTNNPSGSAGGLTVL